MIWFSASISAVDAAALIGLDHRVALQGENIAGADHIRLAEENVAVAVGVRVRRVIDKHALAVVEPPVVGLVGVGGPARLADTAAPCRWARSSC